MSKNEFITNVELIKETWNIILESERICHIDYSDNHPIYRLLSAFIKTLGNNFNEYAAEWIDYYCFELDFGEKYSEGMIRDNSNGTNISLATVEDLYNLIISEN